ncbi:EAL domain-containing protein [Methylobacterium sp.]|jgi:diguanylate cyclase (GGDEF)-like protein/PAS domain S-box-containing protein|uniref:EAL domain-containing protein n=1 Tax=Methylobacterium sp. TaxID=409 RepID=UPI000F9AF96D|nr:EAL domain-containing protein [Methylobacterium sp.]RUP17416.1 MAG: EAL domain-containing protein [Methylobacterium sp.]
MSDLPSEKGFVASDNAGHVLSQRWHAARKPGMILAPYEEVALGSLGRFAEATVLVRLDGDDLTYLQMAPFVAAWLQAAPTGAVGVERSDCARLLGQIVRRALRSCQPEQQIASRVENGIVEVYEITALPLQTHWGFPVTLVHVSQPKTRSSLVEQVYQSTREGVLALTPVWDEQDQLCDFQIVTLNAGAARLIGWPTDDLLWQSLSIVHLGRYTGEIFSRLSVVVKNGGGDEFELEYVRDGQQVYLRVAVSALTDLIVVTLVDITELRTREASFRMMFEANPLPMWVLDAETLRYLDVNTAAVEHYGYSRERFLAMTALDIRPEADRAALKAILTNRTEPYDGEQVWRHIRADGSVIQILPYVRSLVLRGRPAVLVAAIDVTERQLAEAELRRTRSFLDTVVENIPAMLYVQDAIENRVLLLNRAGEELLGVPRADLIGRPAHTLFPIAGAGSAADHEHVSLLSDDGAARVEERMVDTPAHGQRLLHIKRLAVADEAGRPQYFLGIAEDVTERRAVEARIAHMAHHDPLTDLPNRAYFRERLCAVLAQHHRRAEKAAVLCLDLDGFKGVNDTLGHAAGDALLCAVADRLRHTVREDDMVARFGGDEFAILQASAPSPDAAGQLAARLIEHLSKPFSILGQDVLIGASLGIAMLPGDGTTPDPLLNNADLALYQAKAERRGTFRFFEPEMNAQIQARRALERDLRAALSAGALELYYQPLLNLQENRINACEALLRWRHPERGFVSPAEFIPIAEETGLIVPIGEWVLREACREAATWPGEIKVAVNLSPVQFRQQSLVQSVVSALASAELDPRRLELEITESVLLADSDANLAVLHRLRDLGVRIAMDDFGTGYSSLSYLRSFPFDKIKIDQSFVRELGMNRHCAAIVRAVAGLGADLGITTVAEGVETAEQRDRLQQEGCDEMQGYLFSRPLPVAALRQLIAETERTAQAA